MVQGFGIGMLLKRFTEFSLLILAILISGCAFVLMVGSLRYKFLYFFLPWHKCLDKYILLQRILIVPGKKLIMWHSDQTCLFWICQLLWPKIHNVWPFPLKRFVLQNSDWVGSNQNAWIHLNTILPYNTYIFWDIFFWWVVLLSIFTNCAFFLDEPIGLVKIQTTCRNTQRYCTPKRLISYLLSNCFFFFCQVFLFISHKVGEAKQI